MTLVRSLTEEVLDALTLRVRVLSFGQVSRLLGVDALETERVALDLVDAGLLSLEPHIVSELREAEKPLLSWVPDGTTPDFGPVAYALRKRWGTRVEERLLLPTAEACRRFGGTRVRPRASEWTHDLWMSEVYLRHRALGADDEWVSGDTLRSDGEAYLFAGRVPDACLRDSVGEITRVIEGGGEGYGRTKIQAMHGDYATYPYEIW